MGLQDSYYKRKTMESVKSASKSGKSGKSSKSGKSAKTETSVYGGMEFDKTPTTSRIPYRRSKDAKLKFDNDELIRRLEENIQKEPLPVKSVKSEFGKEGKSIKGMQSTSTNNAAKYGKSSKSGEPPKTATSISKGVNKFYGSVKVNQNAAAVAAKPSAVEMKPLELRTEPKEMTYKANGEMQSFKLINKVRIKPGCSTNKQPMVLLGTRTGPARFVDRIETPHENRSSRLRIEHIMEKMQKQNLTRVRARPPNSRSKHFGWIKKNE